jgi:hypothetical protein
MDFKQLIPGCAAAAAKFPSFHQPPNRESYKSEDPDGEDWLTPELREAVAKRVPQEDGGMNVSAGEVNVKMLAAALQEILNEQNAFCNFYQLKQCVALFGNAWGFHISTANAWQLHCCFGKRINGWHKSNASPSKKRVQTSLKNGCAFCVASTPVI